MASYTLGRLDALMTEMLGEVGAIALRTSADPEKDVWARFPCFAMRRSGDAIMDELVETLNVECESPPVPTISHLTRNVSQ